MTRLEQLRAAEMVAGLVLTGWVVWTMLLPSTARDRITAELLQLTAAPLRARKLAAERRRVVTQLQWETFLVGQALASYDGHHDPDQLARDLDASIVIG